jgi:hypothetical protein
MFIRIVVFNAVGALEGALEVPHMPPMGNLLETRLLRPWGLQAAWQAPRQIA